MGKNFIQRPRMQSIPPGLDPIIFSSLGQTDINYENYDETQVFDVVNANLDAAQARLRNNG